jgi:hypothetical protein
MKLNDWKILYRHASSWILYAIAAVEIARSQGVDLSGLPRWLTAALAVAGIAAKLYRQGEPPHLGPGTSDSLTDASK